MEDEKVEIATFKFHVIDLSKDSLKFSSAASAFMDQVASSVKGAACVQPSKFLV